MSNRKWSAVLILVFLSVAALPQLVSAQQPSAGSIAFAGISTGTPSVGNEFTTDVQVTVDVTGTGVIGVEFYLSYSPTLVEPVDVNTATPGVQPAQLLSDFFTSGATPAANEAITAPGIIAPNLAMPGRACPQNKYPCIHISIAGYAAQTKRAGGVARLRWRGVGAGTTAFAFLNPVNGTPYPPPPRTALTDADGYLVPITSTPVTNFDIVAQLGSIDGIVTRQGVPPSVPNTGTQGCTRIDVSETTAPDQIQRSAFTLMSSSTLTLPQSVNTPGGFKVSVKSGAGNYIVRASYPGYLPAQKTGVLTNGSDVIIGPTKLYGGDVNSDGAINILDIVTIIGSLGTPAQPIRSSTASCGSMQGTEGEPSMMPPVDSFTDINDDGVVDISDLSIAAGNFGKTGPTPWAP